MALNRKVTIKKPEWVRSQLPGGEEFVEVKQNLREKGLYTVCEEAKCPNLAECWSAKTATMMILGDTCTRACKFCNVKTGDPKGFINSEEIVNARKMVEVMDLDYLVLTSVDRDDLPDHGAGHFAAIVSEIGRVYPDVKVEVLIPDFGVVKSRMRTLAESKPFVIAQNIETVERLTHPVRDRRAGYEKTLNALKFYAKNYPDIATKSSLMLGFGEKEEEIEKTLLDLKSVGVKIVTLGQYLQPSRRHLGVEKYYKPEEFERYKRMALSMGFEFVASGVMVRSSYKAKDYWDYLAAKESTA